MPASGGPTYRQDEGSKMAQHVSTEVLENGPAYIRANCTRIAAVIAYAAGDAYAAVVAAANVVAAAATTPADFSFTDGANNSRVLSNAVKSVTASADGNPTHFVFLDDTNSKVLRATTENSAFSASAGVQVSLPNLPYESRQPVAV